MRLVLIAALAAVVAQPVTAQTDRFAPDNPWFRDFEAACRVDDENPPMREECQQGVLMGLAEYRGYSNGGCDWYWFWEVADSMNAMTETFSVLPWQYAVEEIFENGACMGYTDYGKTE